MNSKTMVGSLIAAAGLFASGFVIYGYVLTDLRAGGADPNLLYIILGEVVFGYLITTMLSASGTKDMAGGFKSAAILGVTVGLAMALIGIGEATVEMQNGLIDAAVWGVRWGVGGALAGWWLGKD